MRHTELWTRLEQHLGPGYYQVWSEQFVINDLDRRTVREALDAGVQPKEVWAAVHRALELPASER